MDFNDLMDKVNRLRETASREAVHAALVPLAEAYSIESVSTQVLVSHPERIPCVSVHVSFTDDDSIQTVLIDPQPTQLIQGIVDAVTFLCELGADTQP